MSHAESPEHSHVSLGSLWRGAVVAALVALVAVAVLGERGMVRSYHAYREKQALEAELQRLSAEQAQLRQDIDRLQHDRRYIEQVARVELGMVRDNEIVYQLPASR